MAQAAKFLNPIRNSLSLMVSSSSSSSYRPSTIYRSRQLLQKKLPPSVKKWAKEPSIHKLLSKLNSRADAYLSGIRYCVGSTIGVSFLIGCSPRFAFAMDGQDILFWEEEEKEDDSNGTVWMFVRKLWLPVFFFITVLGNWDHPTMLLTKVVLFLLTTKPSPLSVYVFIERLCHQSMRQQPYLYFLKSLYANKVEVQDYKLLCLATVEVRDQKLTLLGILGGWWALPLTQGAFSLSWASALY